MAAERRSRVLVQRLVSEDGDAWLFGKGWSLDGFDFARVKGPRLALNEAALVVPDAVCLTVDLDVLLRLVKGGFQGEVLFPSRLDSELACEPWRSASEKLRIVKFDQFAFVHPPASAVCGVGMLSDHGAARVHLVGFDLFFDPDARGPQGATKLHPYARTVANAMEQAPLRDHDYDVFHEAVRICAAKFGVELIDGVQEVMRWDGKARKPEEPKIGVTWRPPNVQILGVDLSDVVVEKARDQELFFAHRVAGFSPVGCGDEEKAVRKLLEHEADRAALSNPTLAGGKMPETFEAPTLPVEDGATTPPSSVEPTVDPDAPATPPTEQPPAVPEPASHD